MIALWLMAGLLVKHFIFDFPLQSDKMIREKGIYLKSGGIEHSYFHWLGTSIVFLIAGFSFPLAMSLGAVDFTIHYHVDYLKSNITKRFGWSPADRWFWSALGLDQLAHGMTYVLLVLIALR